jgi:hypothetical protein
MKPWIHFCLITLLLPLCAAAAAATASPVISNGEFTPQPNACKSEVAKFEETIGFIRQHQGVEAAAALKEKLLPAKLEAELLATQGYCGVMNYLREKKLNR